MIDSLTLAEDVTLREREATAIEPSWIAITSLLGRVATGKERCCVTVTAIHNLLR